MKFHNSLRVAALARKCPDAWRSASVALLALGLAACSSVSLPPMDARQDSDARSTDRPVNVARSKKAQSAESSRVRAYALETEDFVGEIGEERDRAEVDRLIRTLEQDSADASTEIREAQRSERIAPDSIWTRIRAGFGLPALQTPLVASKVRFYLKQPAYLDRMMTRASRYLYHIVEEIERRGMPTEIALLPFVESAMNPVALSHAQAAGLWQFIPSTGRAYDLKQNWWVDNRRDVVESTRAALDYLQMLHKLHNGDWFLALASYNWGEGSVKRAIRRNKARGRKTDYLSLRMPRETRHYVPKLIALKEILLNADRHGLKLPEVPNKPYFVVIEKTRPIDLDLAAEFAGMTVKDFVALNPAHNRPVISASRNNRIKIPAENLDHFLTAIDDHKHSKRPFVTWRPYTLKKGETIDKVAKRKGISAKKLLRLNSLSSRRNIIAGTRILVPDDRGTTAEKIAAFDAPTVVEIVHRPERYYRVRSNDSLGRIARRFGVKSANLRRWNGLKNNRIFAGQRLLVGQPTRQTVRTNENGRRQVLRATATKTLVYRPNRHHRVKRGDTLSAIADRYGIRTNDLKRWNGIKRDRILVGQKLQVARASTRVIKTNLKPSATRIKVVRGDTLGRIARRHGVSIAQLRQWNGIRGNVIRVGQRLKVGVPADARGSKEIAVAKAPASPKKSVPAKSIATVKVRRGDNLTSIARRHRVSVQDLRRWNGLRSDKLLVGRKLLVSAPARSQVAKHHKVRRGDTLIEIARRYGVSIAHLRRVNKLQGDTIRLGQRLRIHDEKAA